MIDECNADERKTRIDHIGRIISHLKRFHFNTHLNRIFTRIFLKGVMNIERTNCFAPSFVLHGLSLTLS